MLLPRKKVDDTSDTCLMKVICYHLDPVTFEESYEDKCVVLGDEVS